MKHMTDPNLLIPSRACRPGALAGRNIRALGALLILIALPVDAQPPDRPERFERGYGVRNGEAPPPDRPFPRPGRRGPGAIDPHGPPVEQWINLIELQDPEEAQRLRDLHEADPWAFRDVMQQKLFEERLHRILRERHPRLYAFILSEAPEEQTHIIATLREIVDVSPRGPHAGPRAMDRPLRRPFMSPDVSGTVDRLRSETDEMRRRELQHDLRRQLEAERQQRTAERRRQLDEIEQRLMEVRELLNQQQQEQERLIDERIKNLIEEAE